MSKIKKHDWIQIILNLIAFVILISAPTGKGSFWGFATFFILAGLILFEIVSSKDKTAMWVWIVKTFTYALFVWKFASNIGTFHWEYVMMMIISLCTLIISRKFVKKRAIAMWGTNVAYIIGGGMYIIAILNTPEDYGYYHILFWLLNCLSYGVLIIEIIKDKKEKVNFIIPVYAFLFCIVYVVIILFT